MGEKTKKNTTAIVFSGQSERGIFKGLPGPNHVKDGNSSVAPPLKEYLMSK